MYNKLHRVLYIMLALFTVHCTTVFAHLWFDCDVLLKIYMIVSPLLVNMEHVKIFPMGISVPVTMDTPGQIVKHVCIAYFNDIR
jgi:hypothetical protein